METSGRNDLLEQVLQLQAEVVVQSWRICAYTMIMLLTALVATVANAAAAVLAENTVFHAAVFLLMGALSLWFYEAWARDRASYREELAKFGDLIKGE